MEAITLIGIAIYSAVVLGIIWFVMRETNKILEAGLDDIRTRLIVMDAEINKITKIVEQYDKNSTVQPKKIEKEREKPRDLTIRLDADEDYPRPKARLKITPADLPYPSLKVETDQEYPVDKWW